MEKNWQLKHTQSLNQMLRVNTHIDVKKEEFPTLMVIKHEYHIADDIMFPDPACLAFFGAFEEQHLHKLEKDNTLQLVAVDIFEGNMKFYVYCKDGQKSVYDCIEFLKSNKNFTVDFALKSDPSWQTYLELNL